MTTRAKLYQDEWESLQIDTDVEDAELEKYGVDVPDELVATAKRINAEWSAHQAELKSWWESSLPDDDAAAERIAGVAFYEERTWAELRRFDSCVHAAATKSLTADTDRRIAKCDICGEHIYASKLKENIGDGSV